MLRFDKMQETDMSKWTPTARKDRLQRVTKDLIHQHQAMLSDNKIL